MQWNCSLFLNTWLLLVFFEQWFLMPPPLLHQWSNWTKSARDGSLHCPNKLWSFHASVFSPEQCHWSQTAHSAEKPVSPSVCLLFLVRWSVCRGRSVCRFIDGYWYIYTVLLTIWCFLALCAGFRTWKVKVKITYIEKLQEFWKVKILAQAAHANWTEMGYKTSV